MLNLTREKFIEEFNKADSMKELQEKLQCSNWAIQNRMKKYSIPKKEINKEIFLTQIQKNIILGSLLGDGSIMIGKRSKNSYFTYLSSHEDHVYYIYSFLKEYMTERYKNGPIKAEYFDKRTNKSYKSYSIRTQSNICFQKLREEWYKNNLKIIPKSIELNSQICQVWYLGDGGIIKSKNQIASQYIKLSTDGFSIEYVLTIVDKLSNFNARIQYRNKEKTQSAILIPRYKIKEFLNYIGDCPVECYYYKWKYIPCKSPIREQKIHHYSRSI